MDGEEWQGLQRELLRKILAGTDENGIPHLGEVKAELRESDERVKTKASRVAWDCRSMMVGGISTRVLNLRGLLFLNDDRGRAELKAIEEFCDALAGASGRIDQWTELGTLADDLNMPVSLVEARLLALVAGIHQFCSLSMSDDSEHVARVKLEEQACEPEWMREALARGLDRLDAGESEDDSAEPKKPRGVGRTKHPRRALILGLARRHPDPASATFEDALDAARQEYGAAGAFPGVYWVEVDGEKIEGDRGNVDIQDIRDRAVVEKSRIE